MKTWEWGFVIAAVVISALIIFSGCHKPVELEIGERLTTDEARKEVVISITDMKERMKNARATDILRFIFIVAIFGGVWAWIRGNGSDISSYYWFGRRAN